MATLVIDEQGANISFRENRLVITAASDSLNWSIPKMNIERVLIVGKATMTQSALDFFFTESIPVSFMSTSGRFKGFLCGEEGKNVLVRMKQYECFNDLTYKLGISKAIVRQKVNNLRYFLTKHNRYHKNPLIEHVCERMKNLLVNLNNANTTDEVRGIEGACAAAYFEAFGSIFEEKKFQFHKRTRRPPLDPVNAMLSLGYTLILSEIISAVNASGIDVYAGFLHSLDYGRPSLACDIQEEFRFIIDELVVRLVNLGQIKPEHFEYLDNGEVHLNEQAREIFFRSYERKIRQGNSYNGKNTSYRRIVQLQIQHLAKCFFEREIYQPFQRQAG